jgi:hypothetical protein
MFVFQMALKAISPQIEATLNDITQKLQSMISQSKSACQTGANLAAGLLGEVGERNAQMCKTIGNSQGFFSDWAASEQGCGTGGQQASTMARSTDASQPTKSVNYSWDSINTKLPNWDVGWKQYLMTIVGTIIYKMPTDDSTNGSFQFAGNGDEAVLTALLDGGTVNVLKCDDTTDCLNPTLTATTIAQSSGLKQLISAQLADMVTRIQTEQRLTTQEIAILGATSIPVFKILSVSALSQFGKPPAIRRQRAFRGHRRRHARNPDPQPDRDGEFGLLVLPEGGSDHHEAMARPACGRRCPRALDPAANGGAGHADRDDRGAHAVHRGQHPQRALAADVGRPRFRPRRRAHPALSYWH